MNNNLRASSKEIFKINPIGYICLGIFFTLACIGVSFLDLLYSGLILIGLIFIIFPVFFSVLFISNGFEFDYALDFKNFANAFGLYYSPKYFGCFKTLISILKALLVELMASTFLALIFFIFFSSKYGTTFTDALYSYGELYMTFDVDTKTLNDILSANDYLLYNYLMYVSSTAELFGVLTFVFAITFNSFGCYYRMMVKDQFAAIGSRVANQVLKKNRRTLSRQYFALNWPYLLLFALGLASGYLVAILVIKDFTYATIASIIGGLLFSCFFFPKFVANMNAIFKAHKEDFTISLVNDMKDTLSKMKEDLEKTEKNRQDFESTINKMMDDINEDEVVDTQDGDNKKDPNS